MNVTMPPYGSLEERALLLLADRGSRHAGLSLAKLLRGTVVESDVPKRMDRADAPSAIVVRFGLSGLLESEFAVAFERADAQRLGDRLLGRSGTDANAPLDVLARSAIEEVGNIVVSTFIQINSMVSDSTSVPTAPVLLEGLASRRGVEAIGSQLRLDIDVESRLWLVWAPTEEGIKGALRAAGQLK